MDVHRIHVRPAQFASQAAGVSARLGICGQLWAIRLRPYQQLGGGADGGELGRQVGDGLVALQQLVGHILQQAGLPIRRLDVRQPQQRVQLEGCVLD